MSRSGLSRRPLAHPSALLRVASVAFGPKARVTCRRVLLALVVTLAALAPVAPARAMPDTLWLGNDRNTSLDVLNVDKTGTVLQQFNAGSVTGIAVDEVAGDLYLSNTSSTIRRHDLATLGFETSITQSPGPSFGEDMAFVDSFLYRGDFSRGSVWRVDPLTGAATEFITGFSGVVGVAFDGADFWVSSFSSGLVRQYDASGVATGFEFTPERPQGGSVAGLAFDPTDDTLWLGSSGRVYHYDLAGALLGSFEVPDGRLVDGLDYQVPEPSTALLLAAGLVALGRKLKKSEF